MDKNHDCISEGNKLIAEFDGWTKMPTEYKNEKGEMISYGRSEDLYTLNLINYKTISKFKYHSSLDWLKRAIDKFLSIDTSEFNYNATAMTEFRMVRTSLANMPISKSIDDFFNELVTAISWYNQNKQQ